MNVLVTGGCGFLGSHVCAFYRDLGWKVVSYDNMTKYELKRTNLNVELARTYNWNQLEYIGVELVRKDICNFDDLRTAAEDCDFIIHTAAQPAMTVSIEEPMLDFSTNVLGTFNVLETARQLGIPVVSCATIHIYGTAINNSLREEETRYAREPVGIDETHPIMTGILTPLHASKRAAEVYVQAYIDSYGLCAASFRLTGIYGENQFGGEDHGWVAHFTISAIKKQPITLFGNGKQVRDIVYANDVCTAFHAFFEKRQSGIYNIGGGNENAVSLLECISCLEELLGRKVEYRFGGDRTGDLKYFVCDTTNATEHLGWQAKVRPRDGIKRLANWVNNNRKIFNA